MKKTYVRPTAIAETFAVNNYCSACGMTSDGTYHFTCDAAAGPLYYYPSGSGDASYIGSYHPCSATHDTKDRSNFYEGFVDTETVVGYTPLLHLPIYDYNGVEDEGEHVLVWRGDSGKNGHATVSLNMGTIDVVRS